VALFVSLDQTEVGVPASVRLVPDLLHSRSELQEVNYPTQRPLAPYREVFIVRTPILAV